MRHLDQDLAHGARFHLFECIVEVLFGDLDLFQDVHRYGLVQLQFRDQSAQALHGRLTGQGGKVCPDETMGGVRILLDVETF